MIVCRDPATCTLSPSLTMFASRTLLFLAQHHRRAQHQVPSASLLARLYRPGQESTLPDDLSNRVAKAFARSPEDTSRSIVEQLDTEQRFVLAKALLDSGVPVGGRAPLQLDEAYVARLFETVDVHHPKGLLDR